MLTAEQAAWEDSVVGVEAGKRFGDRSSLLMWLADLGRHYVWALQDSGGVPPRGSTEWVTRREGSIRPSDKALMDSVVGPGEPWASVSEYWFTLYGLGQMVLPAVESLEKALVEREGAASAGVRTA